MTLTASTTKSIVNHQAEVAPCQHRQRIDGKAEQRKKANVPTGDTERRAAVEVARQP
jgi:hypothetical protein